MVGGGLRGGAEGVEKTENGLEIQPENEPETLVNMKRFQKKNLEIQPAECLSQDPISTHSCMNSGSVCNTLGRMKFSISEYKLGTEAS